MALLSSHAWPGAHHVTHLSPELGIILMPLDCQVLGLQALATPGKRNDLYPICIITELLTHLNNIHLE